MIQARRLNKLYGRQKALEDLSLRVEPGEVVGLLGPQGAGKTTALRILAGWFPPNSGTVKVSGYDLLRQPRPAKRRIGYLPQQLPLYPHLSVDEYLRLLYNARGGAREPFAKRLAYVKEQCGLSAHGTRRMSGLSACRCRRLGLAQSLIHDPEVLIFDEPAQDLDPQQTAQLRELIRGLGRDRAVIVSTDSLPEMDSICSRVLVLSGGRLLAQGSPRQLRALLGGGALLEIEVDGPVESLPRRLLALPGVRDAVLEESPGQGRLLLVEAEAGADVRAASAKTVMDSGCSLLGLKTREASLGDIFMHLTTEDGSARPSLTGDSGPDSHPRKEGSGVSR